jgi:Na+-driven multidrug efflux pump
MLHFGAKGAIIQPATDFLLLLSVPFLALCMMMGNNIIRAEGKAKFAMVAMIIPF